MKYFALLFISYLFIIPAQTNQSEVSLPEKSFYSTVKIENKADAILHEKCLYPTVKIENTKSYGGGSGVIVQSVKVSENEYFNVAITCAHVIEKEPDENFKVLTIEYENWSKFVKYISYSCKIYKIDAPRDLAVILFISDHKLPVADFGFNEKLFIGSKIFHFGCGLGEEPRLDRGEITSLRGKSYRTNMFLIFGDSGGPIFHDSKLIGFAQSIYCYQRVSPIPISFIIPIQEIKSWNNATNNALEFIYKSEKKLPQLPFMLLRMGECELSNLSR